MKNNRNRWLLLLLGMTLSGLAGGCHKDCDDRNWENGVIIGADYRECACCGGWFIEIDGDTLRAQTFPDDFAATLSGDVYPVAVRLRWERDATPCLGDEIEVLAIQRR